jgi:hypothetical protein
MANIPEKVADDLLRGLRAIADEVGLSVRQTHYGLTQGRIPAGLMLDALPYREIVLIDFEFTADPASDQARFAWSPTY